MLIECDSIAALPQVWAFFAAALQGTFDALDQSSVAIREDGSVEQLEPPAQEVRPPTREVGTERLDRWEARVQALSTILQSWNVMQDYFDTLEEQSGNQPPSGPPNQYRQLLDVVHEADALEAALQRGEILASRPRLHSFRTMALLLRGFEGELRQNFHAAVSQIGTATSQLQPYNDLLNRMLFPQLDDAREEGAFSRQMSSFVRPLAQVYHTAVVVALAMLLSYTHSPRGVVRASILVMAPRLVVGLVQLAVQSTMWHEFLSMVCRYYTFALTIIMVVWPQMLGVPTTFYPYIRLLVGLDAFGLIVRASRHSQLMLVYLLTMVLLPILSNGELTTSVLGSLLGMVLDCIVLPSILAIALRNVMRARYSAAVRSNNGKGPGFNRPSQRD